MSGINSPSSVSSPAARPASTTSTRSSGSVPSSAQSMSASRAAPTAIASRRPCTAGSRASTCGLSRSAELADRLIRSGRRKRPGCAGSNLPVSTIAWMTRSAKCGQPTGLLEHEFDQLVRRRGTQPSCDARFHRAAGQVTHDHRCPPPGQAGDQFRQPAGPRPRPVGDDHPGVRRVGQRVQLVEDRRLEPVRPSTSTTTAASSEGSCRRRASSRTTSTPAPR